jgi:HK97 gp10 family phage protein
MAGDWDLTELNRLTIDLGAAGYRGIKRAQQVIAKTGHGTVARAQQIVPVDTGNLRNSIGVDLDPDGLGFEAGPTASYGHYVEYGTSRQGPASYMGPAFDYQVAEAMKALRLIVPL